MNKIQPIIYRVILSSLLILLLLSPVYILAQNPIVEIDTSKKWSLTFEELPEGRKGRTRFTGLFKGVWNGQRMELSFQEKKYKKKLYLLINLRNTIKNKTYRGITKVNPTTFLLEEVLLLDERGNMEIIKTLFLHNYNRNFINLISGRGHAACFSKKETTFEHFSTPNSFKKTENFVGKYSGRIDGRPAKLSIQLQETGYLIRIDDQEQKKEYLTFVNKLPADKNVYTLTNISLKDTVNNKELLLGELVLDIKTTNVISGYYYRDDKKVGLFFLRKNKK